MKFLFAIAALGVALSSAAQQITWSQHIAPIVFKNCTSCHRPGEIAPFPLLTYNDMIGRSYTMRSQIVDRKMPPWKPDSGFGTFVDNRRLAQSDIDLIVNWLDSGSPRGDSSLEPAPPVFPTGSRLGTPDLVLKMSKPYFHKGDHTDMYRCFVMPTGLLHDQYISALEFRPGNASIVHHALFFVDTSGKGKKLDAADPDGGYLGFGGPGFTPAETPGGWAPGYTPRFLPPGIAWKFPKGCDLVMQIHYAPEDSDQYDQSSVNVFFNHDNNPRQALTLPLSPDYLVDGPFVIPPNVTKHFTAKFGLPIDLSFMEVAPHMHLLGKMMKAYAVSPTGDTIPMIWISDWDFHWQGAYMFPHMLHIPRGDTIVVESEYDNTTNNFNNPNSPPKQTQWGESTHDEMMLCYFLGLLYAKGDENIDMATPLTAVHESTGVPLDIALAAPYANPATSDVTIPFSIAHDSHVTLSIVSMLGEEVARLATNRAFSAGPHMMSCSVASLPAGTYVCQLSSSGEVVTRALRVVH